MPTALTRSAKKRKASGIEKENRKEDVNVDKRRKTARPMKSIARTISNASDDDSDFENDVSTWSKSDKLSQNHHYEYIMDKKDKAYEALLNKYNNLKTSRKQEQVLHPILVQCVKFKYG